jgi:hypothetical protein
MATSATLTLSAPVITQAAPTTPEERDAFLLTVADLSSVEYAPGRVGGRQASFDAVAAWQSSGAID